MVTTLNIDTIVSDTAIHNGQPIIAGTALRVSDIVASHLYRGLMPEDLAVQFKLSLGQVYAALAYYYINKAGIDADMRLNAETAEKLLADLDRQGKLIRIE